jgi:hypothetical protein
LTADFYNNFLIEKEKEEILKVVGRAGIEPATR